MKKSIIFALLLSSVISCKKNKEDVKTCKQDMAGISGNYKITAVSYKSSSASPEQDYYNLYFTSACEKDDVYGLNSNGTFTLTDAGLRCSPSGDGTGTWSVNGNAGYIGPYAITVQSFNCSTLVIVWPDYYAFGDQVKLTFTRQ